MDSKLTLRLSDNVIKRAKIYAREHQISLSKLIETYLDSITKQNDNKNIIEITPLVQSLSGVIDVPDDYDHRKEYREHIEEKYK